MLLAFSDSVKSIDPLIRDPEGCKVLQGLLISLSKTTSLTLPLKDGGTLFVKTDDLRWIELTIEETKEIQANIYIFDQREAMEKARVETDAKNKKNEQL